MKFALIGHPVEGSLSPRLFSAAYGGRYPYDLIDRECFEDAWRLFLEQYDGINVTAPFKQDAFARVDVLSEEARRSGAVNLVVKKADKLYGYNTDVDGVVGAVRETGFQPSDTLIIGAGGAAMAAVVGAKILGSGTITIANRTYEKAAALAAAHSCNAVPLDAIGTLSPDLIIYTIPGGAPVVPGMPLGGAVVLEAEYKRPSLSSAPCRRYISGLRWILHQAVAGYSLFTGEAPDLEALSRSIIC